MKSMADDHFHHYTWGDTNEPDVSGQLDPVTTILSDHERRLAKLEAQTRTLGETVDQWKVLAFAGAAPPKPEMTPEALMAGLWEFAATRDVDSLEASYLETARKVIARVTARRSDGR